MLLVKIKKSKSTRERVILNMLKFALQAIVLSFGSKPKTLNKNSYTLSSILTQNNFE